MLPTQTQADQDDHPRPSNARDGLEPERSGPGEQVEHTRIGDRIVISMHQNVEHSFAQPVGARFGTTGRNTLSGPGTFGLNGKLARSIAVREKLRLDLRAEAFNLTNTPQPNAVLGPRRVTSVELYAAWVSDDLPKPFK